MDLKLSPEIEAVRLEIRAFVKEHILPLEKDPAMYDEHENIAHEPLQKLRAKAKSQGLWSLQMPKHRGGGGLPIVGLAACYEEMSHSIFGPVCFNSAAPDDGNMLVLEKTAREDQKQRWLQPIIDGDAHSAFAMTEPVPGAGSDPSLMLTTAKCMGEGKDKHWIIHGQKSFITGAQVAKHFILIARTSDDSRKGLTAFLFHRDQPGWHIKRRIPIMGPEEHGGHCEIIFDGLKIADDQRLMEVGDGLKVTQIRLGIARLTHCMRWLGLSKRALSIAVEYVRDRDSFGLKLIDRESVQGLLAEAAMQIEIGRLLTMKAAVELDNGSFARKEVSMAKVQVADTLHKAVDTSLQLCGAHGYSKDTPLEWMYRYARQARLVDGASEVHRMVMARFLIEDGENYWHWS